MKNHKIENSFFGEIIEGDNMADLYQAGIEMWGRKSMEEDTKVFNNVNEQYKVVCPSCNGKGWSGKRDANGKPISCKKCNGTGIK